MAKNTQVLIYRPEYLWTAKARESKFGVCIVYEE